LKRQTDTFCFPSSLFYTFVVHLTLMIIVFTTLCIANLVIHYDEVRENPVNVDLTGGDVFYEVFAKYWASMVGAFIAVLFSIFVFGLCGFHTYLINRNLTTQEKLKHVYEEYPRSPFSHGTCLRDWRKVICCPSITPTRLYYMLYLKHRKEEKFD